MLISCTIQRTSKTYRITGYEEKYKLKTDTKAQKIIYDSLERVVYIWEKDTDLIHIYHGQIKKNTIGGSGISGLNFQKLSDICLSADGQLLTLDSFGRQIKKIDKNGNLIGEINLEHEIDPVLLATSLDEKFYIWDENRKEVIILNSRGQKIETHTDLELEGAECLEVYDDMIAIYDLQNMTTSFFSKYGQLLDQLNGRCFCENGIYFKLDDHFIIDLKENNKFAINPHKWQSLTFQDPEIILYDGKWTKIGELKYEHK